MQDVVNIKSKIIPIDVTPGTTRVDKRTLKHAKHHRLLAISYPFIFVLLYNMETSRYST